MTLVEQLSDPVTRIKYADSAHTLLKEGIREFEGGKYPNAEFYLGISGRIFHELGDKFYARITRGWFVNTVKRNPDSNYKEQLPDWCQ